MNQMRTYESSLTLRVICGLLCVSLVLFPVPAKAASYGEALTVAVVVLVGAGVLIGVGAYHVAHRAPSIAGCAADSQGGLTLQPEAEQQTYTLIGDTAMIKAGERIKVTGRKTKKDAAGGRQFLVEKLAKDYGPCKVSQLHPWIGAHPDPPQIIYK